MGGVLHNLDPRALSLGVAFAGIVVAALAQLSPFGVIPVAILVASFTNAEPGLQVLGIPSEIVILLEGILFLCIVGGEWFLRKALRVHRGHGICRGYRVMNESALLLSLASALVIGTPILLAGLGEMMAEHSGVMNLGVEGMMLG